MTIEAPTRTAPHIAPLPPAPVRVAPAEAARPGPGSGAATKAPPPPPPEPELMAALSPPEAARIAVKALHELQGEFRALKQDHPHNVLLLDAKSQELELAQGWAIKAATRNRDLAAAADKQADGERQNLRSQVNTLSNNLSWNEGGHERSRLSLLEQDLIKADVAYDSAHARLLDAESLLQQAKSSLRGNVDGALQDQKEAQERHFVADMKLRAAAGQPDPRIAATAKQEFDAAQAGLKAAARRLNLALTEENGR